MHSEFDIVIVGCGLAGAAAAWTLRERGRRVLVIDDGRHDSASRVAAGLITPVTGPRLATPLDWAESWSTCRDFYDRISRRLEQPLLRVATAVRLLAPAEHERAAVRMATPGSLLRALQHELDIPNCNWEGGALEMFPAAQLDVTAYLEGVRSSFLEQGQWIADRLDWDHDLEWTPDGARLPRWGVTAGCVVQCVGWPGAAPPGFPTARFRPAVGEVLLLRVPDWPEQRVIHGPVWIVPESRTVLRVGASFRWDRFHEGPTEAGRRQLLNRFQQISNTPYEVIDHHAAIRPATVDQAPLLQQHSQRPRAWSLNGLGSRGVLRAPRLAAELADRLARLDSEIPRTTAFPPAGAARFP